MRTQREGRDVESRVVRWARERGIECDKLETRYQTGRPDRVFWVEGGRAKLIEFKKPGGTTALKQEHIHGLLRALGYDVEIHDNFNDAVASLTRAVEAARRSKEGR